MLDTRVHQAFTDAGLEPPQQSRVDRVGFTPAERLVLHAATLRRELAERAAAAPADAS